jgi:hypothetical protein
LKEEVHESRETEKKKARDTEVETIEGDETRQK